MKNMKITMNNMKMNMTQKNKKLIIIKRKNNKQEKEENK